MQIKLGSAFAGIGGFELGLEWAIPEIETVWQIEQDSFCQSILKKHWPHSKIYNDITTIETNNLEDVHILTGGFPCQDLSLAGKGEGLDGKKSGLFWELWRIVRDFKEQRRQIPIVLLENVPTITFRGLGNVLGAFSELGYNAEWFVISAKDFGACHLRERWFCVFYVANPNSKNLCSQQEHIKKRPKKILSSVPRPVKPPTNTIGKHGKKHPSYPVPMEKKSVLECTISKKKRVYTKNHWQESPAEPPICSVDDGISNRVAKLKALGNAIVPQCTEWIGKRMIETGLLRDVLCY
tara:strand:+ start:3682 stop:4566 length:885 start_codon:yes stop_codon:yes gene_type:complete